jgi:hypothetical protein
MNPATPRFTKQIVFTNREVYALNDAFSVSHLSGGSGHSNFSVDGRAGLPDGLRTSQPRESRAKQCFAGKRYFAPSEFSRPEPDEPDGRNGELSSSLWRQRAGKTQRPHARSRWCDVLLSSRSHARLETGHSDPANFSCPLLRSAMPFQLGAGSLSPFSRICSLRLAQRQRHTP